MAPPSHSAPRERLEEAGIESFGTPHCYSCGGDELKLDESGEFFAYDKTTGENRLICVECGPQDKFPIRDVCWADEVEAALARSASYAQELEEWMTSEREAATRDARLREGGDSFPRSRAYLEGRAEAFDEALSRLHPDREKADG